MRTQSPQLGSRYQKLMRMAPYLVFLGAFSIYLVVRLVAWKNTVLLEDTDSLAYLDSIELLLDFDLWELIDLDPDSTPFYPLFGALFSLPGWSVETGARLTSLFFSSVLFVAVLGIGKQIAETLEVVLGLVILSFNPVLISLSFGVLTEPSYVAMIYLGFWLFWTQYRNLKLWKAALLGIVFGLAFLNRVEGILYLGIMPILQGVYAFTEGQKKRGLKRLKQLVGWIVVFVVSFCLLAVPQIWRVSHKMGIFAINGRQVWSLVLNNPDGRSKEEKIFGLDFSPSQYNIEYVKSHPEVLGQFESKTTPVEYVKTIVKNFNELYREELGTLIGPLGLIFFGFGILALYQSGHRFEVFLILVSIGFNLVGPFLHDVDTRHIITIAPVIFLTAGVGIVYLSRSLLDGCERSPSGKYVLCFIFLLALIGAWAPPLLSALKPPARNAEYSPAEIEEPSAIVQEIAESELHRVPVITAQRGYLAHFAGGKQIYLPYTEYEGLVKYCDLNSVDFLYLKHRRVKDYPFFRAFMEDSTNVDFTLLYSGADAYGEKTELYRFGE